MEIQDSSKRPRSQFPLSAQKKLNIATSTSGFLYLRSLVSPFINSSTGSIYQLICLQSDRLYTFGRKNGCCEFVFEDSCVSKRHCQVFLDSFERKIFIVDGFFSFSTSDVDEIKKSLRCQSDWQGVSASLNGVFVNRNRIRRGSVVNLSIGDEVSFVCGSGLDPILGIQVGFVVERVVFVEEIEGKREEVECFRSWDACSVLDSKANRFVRDSTLCRLGNAELSARASFLLSKCRGVLQSADPILYIRKHMNFDKSNEIVVPQNSLSAFRRKYCLRDLILYKMTEVSSSVVRENCREVIENEQIHSHHLRGEPELVNGILNGVRTGSIVSHADALLGSENCSNCLNQFGVPKAILSGCLCPPPSVPMDCIGNCEEKAVDNKKLEDHPINSNEKCQQSNHNLCPNKDSRIGLSSAGKRFFLNRLDFEDHGLHDQHTSVSLPELIYPVGTLLRIFIATFTSDILWFLSCCELPKLLHITVACHNTERCWSPSHDKRTSMPYSDYPNLVIVYPPFPDVVAFGKDRKKQGIACHHPKLIVLQREESIRIIVTSANLVSKQWNSVTNTVWWQDFPRKSMPGYSSLFNHLSSGESNKDSKSDFAAQLAGFMSCLVADVPSQAHWIIELAKYDFDGAVGHLVASIPGIHMRSPHPSEPLHFLSVKCVRRQSIGMKFLGTVHTSVVGLSHRFRTTADSKGTQLKTLASFLEKCRENGYGMTEVVLKRNANIPVDKNAVSVLVSDLDEYSEGEYLQLGFLPKDVAKWVSPLCDSGFFSFSACIYPKEALAAALGGSNNKVQLILHVFQGPKFSEISKLIHQQHVAPICSLLASIQRCSGLWRLQEVLHRYKWPESLETDFIYGSSSIGTSVDAKFLAAFSAAAGKRSHQFSESEESDPEWGCWNANLESRSPSLRIIFPTIKRVKNGACGIWPSRRLLSFSEKTWQRLRKADIFHDAVPHPGDRAGYPMHVKVARRRFQSKTDESSFGWVYCGSHNFSPAAWGNPISHSPNVSSAGETTTSILGSGLRICNYELGIIFIVHPSEISKNNKEKSSNLDNIILPFVVPAPKYRCHDRPATAHAMGVALAESVELHRERYMGVMAEQDLMDEVTSDGEEEIADVDATNYVAEEREEEKIYAELLWSQVDSSEL